MQEAQILGSNGIKESTILRRLESCTWDGSLMSQAWTGIFKNRAFSQHLEIIVKKVSKIVTFDRSVAVLYASHQRGGEKARASEGQCTGAASHGYVHRQNISSYPATHSHACLPGYISIVTSYLPNTLGIMSSKYHCRQDLGCSVQDSHAPHAFVWLGVHQI